MLSTLSKQQSIYLIGGSIPEIDKISGNIYNTSIVFDPQGQIIAKHRKVHLFDINVPGKINFRESDTLTAGSKVTTFETPWCTMGLGICYDMRFPEYAACLIDRGSQVIVYPGAFNTVTGPLHWEVIQRGRAVDTQCFIASVSPARNPEASYQAWGHSTVTSPWGEVLATTGHDEDVLVVDIDLTQVKAVRTSIPVLNQKRTDVYSVITE